jgi:hypothetical protein
MAAPDFLVIGPRSLPLDAQLGRQVTGLAVNAADADSAIRQVAGAPGEYIALALGDATRRVVSVDRRMTLSTPTT